MTSGIIGFLAGAGTVSLASLQGLGLLGWIGLVVCAVVSVLSLLLFVVGVAPRVIGGCQVAWRHLKGGADKPEAVEADWLRQAETFEGSAKRFWRALKVSFVASDIHLAPKNFDSLHHKVVNAYWPDDEPEYSDRNRSSASTDVREMARRIYQLGGKPLFSNVGEADDLDDLRDSMAKTILRWAHELEGDGGDRFEVWIRKRLGVLHLWTLKLLWYVEEANAKFIHNDEPNYHAMDRMRSALMPLAPDTASKPKVVDSFADFSRTVAGLADRMYSFLDQRKSEDPDRNVASTAPNPSEESGQKKPPPRHDKQTTAQFTSRFRNEFYAVLEEAVKRGLISEELAEGTRNLNLEAHADLLNVIALRAAKRSTPDK